jgi:MFS family permease
MDNARGPFFPLFLEATGESSSQGALFFAVTSFIAILSSAASSFVLERAGLKFLLFLGGLCMAVSPFGLIFTPNLNGALTTAFFFGLGLGWVAVGQNVLISLVERVDLRRQLFALLHCFYALAAMTAPLSVLWLKKSLPWNWLLVGETVLCVPFLFFLIFIKSENKDELPKERVLPPPLFDPTVLRWVFFLSFYIASELILSTRLVIFVQGLGLDFAESSRHLFWFFLSMFFSRLAFFFVRLPFPAAKILMFCLGFALSLIALGYTKSTYFFALTGAAIGPVFPVVMDEMSRTWPKRFDVLVSRVIALSSMFVVTAHMVVGKLTDLYGIDKAMYSVPLLMASAFVIILTKRIKSSAL